MGFRVSAVSLVALTTITTMSCGGAPSAPTQVPPVAPPAVTSVVWTGRWIQGACIIEPTPFWTDLRSASIRCSSLRPAGIALSAEEKSDGTVTGRLFLMSGQTNVATTYTSGDPLPLDGAWSGGRLVLMGSDRDSDGSVSSVRERSFEWDSNLDPAGTMLGNGTFIERAIDRVTGRVSSITRKLYLLELTRS
jgi:hypothetical protein